MTVRTIGRRRRASIAASVLAVALAGVYVTNAPAHHATPRHSDAMSVGCWRALAGYVFAEDQETADFWAESWRTFGCGGSGYYA